MFQVTRYFTKRRTIIQELWVKFQEIGSVADRRRANKRRVKTVVHDSYILGQKRNAAYKTYIVYGGSFTNLSQTICRSMRADSWIMSSWGCPS